MLRIKHESALSFRKSVEDELVWLCNLLVEVEPCFVSH